MEPSDNTTLSYMLLRSGYAKCCVSDLDQREQTTNLSRRAATSAASRSSDNALSLSIGEIPHRYIEREHGHRYETRESLFLPDLTSTPSRITRPATHVGILSRGEHTRTSRFNKKVHFEISNYTPYGDKGNGVTPGHSYSVDGEVKCPWVKLTPLEPRGTTLGSGGTLYTNVRAQERGSLEKNILNGSLSFGGQSSSQLHTAMAAARPGTSSSRGTFSSDEEDTAADTSGLSSESNANFRPVYVIRDAASYGRVLNQQPSHASARSSSTHSTSNSIATFVSAVAFSACSGVYRSICSVFLFDAWLLSRFTEKQKRQIGLLVLLLLLLTLFWLYNSSEESTLSPVASTAPGAATSLWDTVEKTSSVVWGSLIGIPSLLRAPFASWPSWSSRDVSIASEAKTVTEGVSSWQLQLREEDLRKIVRKLVAEQLQKWESSKNLASQDQVQNMGTEVRGMLRSDLNNLEEQNRGVSADVDKLKTKVQQLDTVNNELRLEGAKLQKCCQDSKGLLEGVDAKIEAAVLEALNQPSVLMSETGFHKWVLTELSTRDSRLSVALNDLRHKIADAAVASERADKASQEASRLADEAHVGIAGVRSQVSTMATTKPCPDSGGVDGIDVKRVVKEALMLYDADKTAQPDYALESAGGTVVNTRCTETYGRGTAHYQVFGIPIWTMSRTPREAIQPGVSPGECWAFRGSSGNLVLQLAMSIRPTGFTVEHIPRSLAISGSLDSAPREFTILGLESDKDFQGKVLGKYVYDIDGDPLQYFPVQEPDPGAFQFVEMQITSNHGNLEYTCLYRIRVHGVPSS